MRVAVIGGTGFIGQPLSKELLRLGCEVTVIHASATDSSHKIVGATDIRIDVTAPGTELYEALRAVDVVVMLTRPLEKQIEHLLASLAQTSVKRIVFASTMILYPDSPEKSTEETRRDPLTEYEKAKAHEEDQLIAFANSGAAQVCIARLGNVYGGIMNRGVVHYVVEAARNGTPFRINGDGGHVRDFIFIDDVVHLLASLVMRDHPEPVEIFNVTSGVGTSLLELISAVENATGKKIETVTQPAIEEKRSVVCDNAKVLQVVQSALRYDLASGLRKTLLNYEQRI